MYGTVFCESKCRKQFFYGKYFRYLCLKTFVKTLNLGNSSRSIGKFLKFSLICNHAYLRTLTEYLKGLCCALLRDRYGGGIAASFKGALAFSLTSKARPLQGCRNGRMPPPPPDFGISVKPIATRGEQVMPTILLLAPRIFRPSYGPALCNFIPTR